MSSPVSGLSDYNTLAQLCAKIHSDLNKSNLFGLPEKSFSPQQIENANKFHASLQKSGLEGYYHDILKCIIIKSHKMSSELQEIIDNDSETTYVNWKPEVKSTRDYQGNALVYLNNF
jgi:hypothetical protein